MFDKEESLLPRLRDQNRALKVVIVGKSENQQQDPPLEEMVHLLQTLGVEVISSHVAPVRKINPATYLGKGKVEQIKSEMKSLPVVDAVIFDWDLSSQQLRNLEKIFKKPTIDRGGVIIEIFSQNAKTREAKTQVELAKLEYLLPRLAHYWSHFERQRGGIGLKGMGEKQLEVDRRLLKKRIQVLKDRLKVVAKNRDVQRASRKNVLQVALVGYTNAGKSTLLNALTQSEVLAEDKLFATLDSSARALDPNSHPPVIAIDTVGFISHIPTHLIASFRSTLEEVFQADLILHVVDASSDHAKEQYEVTQKILKDLELDTKKTFVVMNKVDQIQNPADLNQVRTIVPGAIRTSALNQKDVRRLRDQILDYFKKQLELWDIVLPYSEQKLESQIHDVGSIEQKKYLEKGTYFQIRIHKSWAKRLELERYHLKTRSISQPG